MSSVTNTPDVYASREGLLHVSEVDAHEEKADSYLEAQKIQKTYLSVLENALHCLETGKKISYPNEALVIAACVGNLRAVQLLIKNFTPQPNVLGTALVQAAGSGRFVLVAHLLNQKISKHYLHLAHLSAELGNHPEIAEILRPWIKD